jgi:raffinose/stachyose/melibiose transport system permease protein
MMEKARRIQKSSSNKERKKTMLLFTLPASILYVAFFMVTMFIGIYYSLTDWNGISQDYKLVGIQNYITVMQDSRFRQALLFNIIYTILLVAFVTVIALLVAMALNNVKRFSTAFRSIYFVPAVISMVTVGLIWNELFYRAMPMLGKVLNIEWLSTSLLGNPKTAMYAILLVNLWQGCAVPTVLFLAGLQSVPRDLQEAAIMDGAGHWARFRNITVPYLIPVLNMVIITQAKAGLTVFDYIKVMTNGGPAQATEAVGLLIFRHAINEGKFSRSVAESMILFVIVGAVAAISLKITSKNQVGE